MRGITSWNANPYKLLNAPETKHELFINRIIPIKGGFQYAYQDTRDCGHILCYRPMASDAAWSREPAENNGCVRYLEESVDYTVYIERADGTLKSTERYVCTGGTIGTVVNYLHPMDLTYAFSGRFLCSPSLVVLPGGKMIASMDVYAPRHAQNLTLLYESADNGSSWTYLTDLFPCYWGKLFFHRGRLYMLAVSTEYGDLLIGASVDEGKTWSPPVRLFNGTNSREIGPHKAPMPVVEHEGRLYTGIDYGSWKYGSHDSAILSISVDAELLNPSDWSLTKPLAFDTQWPGLPGGALRGCLEGNAVVDPDGKIVNILRLEQYHAEIPCGHAVILEMIDSDKPLQFRKVIQFPLGANSKFVVLKDGGFYIAVGNEWIDHTVPRARNVLSLAVSKDLENWKVVKRIVDMRESSAAFTAFQYPDMQVYGDDLLVLSRTAWNGAHSFHDSNMVTFHRVENFRKYYSEASFWTEPLFPHEMTIPSLGTGNISGKASYFKMEAK